MFQTSRIPVFHTAQCAVQWTTFSKKSENQYLSDYNQF